MFQPRLDLNSTEIFFYCSYTLGYLAGLMETFLILQLINNMKIKFVTLNIRLQSSKPRNLRKIFPLQRDEVIEKLEREANQFTMDRINEIVATHYLLTMTSRKLNDVFGIPILVLLIIDFQAITSSFYVFLKFFPFFNKLTGILPMMKVLLVLMWPIIIFTEIFIISKNFDDATEKVSLVYSPQLCATIKCFRQKIPQGTYTNYGTCKNIEIKK